jgi:hypothetical protein
MRPAMSAGCTPRCAASALRWTGGAGPDPRSRERESSASPSITSSLVLEDPGRCARSGGALPGASSIPPPLRLLRRGPACGSGRGPSPERLPSNAPAIGEVPVSRPTALLGLLGQALQAPGVAPLQGLALRTTARAEVLRAPAFLGLPSRDLPSTALGSGFLPGPSSPALPAPRPFGRRRPAPRSFCVTAELAGRLRLPSLLGFATLRSLRGLALDSEFSKSRLARWIF